MPSSALSRRSTGVPGYWIVDLPDRALHVYRDPAGDAYRMRATHAPGETVAPQARPDAPLAVADLLP